MESQELARIIKTYPEAGTHSYWTFDDVSRVVLDAQQAYENKKKLLSGKPQKIYHDVMCNLDAHSGVLSMIPQGNTYLSVVAGAVKTLVKVNLCRCESELRYALTLPQASVSHRRTIEDLTTAIKHVNDEAHACIADIELVPSDATLEAVAKFYIATFMFYGDAIKWFQSSSGRKIWHSLDEKFSERFNQRLAEIKRLSTLVQRASSRGSGAETRVTRLAIEDVTEDIRAGREGAARETAERRQNHAQILNSQERMTTALHSLRDPEIIKRLAEELWHQIGAHGTALLVSQNGSIPTDQSIKGLEAHPQSRIIASSTNDSPTMNWLSGVVERLLDGIIRGTRDLEVDDTPALVLDQRIALILERWTLKTTSTILYLEAGPHCIEARLPQVTVAAARIVKAAEKVKMPTISFFCDASPSGDTYYHETREELTSPLFGLVYSLIYQLTKLIPPLTDVGHLVASSQAGSLDASLTIWASTLQIFQSLLEMAPPFLLCIIDGYYTFENPTLDSSPTHTLFEVFRKAETMNDKVFKLLLTNSSRAFSLVEEVPLDQCEIIEGSRRPGIGRGAPAGRVFTDFEIPVMYDPLD